MESNVCFERRFWDAGQSIKPGTHAPFTQEQSQPAI